MTRSLLVSDEGGQLDARRHRACWQAWASATGHQRSWGHCTEQWLRKSRVGYRGQGGSRAKRNAP